MTRRAIVAAATLSALAAAGAAAQGVDRQARAWAATCAPCHGTDGHALGAMPALAGRDADELLAALRAFRDGRRPGATVMHQNARGFDDDELRRIAAYFAGRPAR